MTKTIEQLIDEMGIVLGGDAATEAEETEETFSYAGGEETEQD